MNGDRCLSEHINTQIPIRSTTVTLVTGLDPYTAKDIFKDLSLL